MSTDVQESEQFFRAEFHFLLDFEVVAGAPVRYIDVSVPECFGDKSFVSIECKPEDVSKEELKTTLAQFVRNGFLKAIQQEFRQEFIEFGDWSATTNDLIYEESSASIGYAHMTILSPDMYNDEDSPLRCVQQVSEWLKKLNWIDFNPSCDFRVTFSSGGMTEL